MRLIAQPAISRADGGPGHRSEVCLASVIGVAAQFRIFVRRGAATPLSSPRKLLTRSMTASNRVLRHEQSAADGKLHSAIGA
jgi:hypothetical protein